MRALSILIAILVLLHAPHCGRAESYCGAQPLAELPLHDAMGFLVLQAAVNDTPVSMLLDTGAEAGLIAPDAAAGLHLPIDPRVGSVLEGTGGTTAVHHNVLVDRLRLGNVLVRHATLPVGVLPAAPRITPSVIGLVGADILARFDVLMDMRRGKLDLYAPGLCHGGAPWPGARGVALHRQGPRLAFDALLDGLPLRGLIDSGTRSVALSPAAARRLGVDDAALARDPGGVTAGVDLHDMPFHWHRFGALQLGPDDERHPVLTVTPIGNDADLLLGSSWFADRVVWISWTDQLLFARLVRSAGVNQPVGPLHRKPDTE